MSLTDKRIEEILKEVEPHAVRLPLGWKLFARAIEAEATKPQTIKSLAFPNATLEATKPQEPSSPGAFEEWYDTKFKHEFERGPNDKYVARKAWFAALYTTPQPCQSCAEKQSAIDVWEGRYADLSAKCAELEAEVEKWSTDFVRISDNYSEEAQMNMDFGAERLAFILKEQKQAERIAELERVNDICKMIADELPKTTGSVNQKLLVADLQEAYDLINKGRIAELEAERDALAMHNQQMREALRVLLKFAETVGPSSCFWEDVWPEHENAECCDHSEIIKRHDAAVLRKAAEVCESRQTPGTGSVAILSGAADDLLKMAAELEKP